MKNLTVNLISESVYLPKGHGVHTAFLNTMEMLKEKKVQVLVNSRQKADITHIHTVGPFAWYKLISSKNTVVSAHVIPGSFEGSLVLTSYWLGSAKQYLSYFYNKADLVLAVAPKVKEELVKMGVTSPIEVFPNPIDLKTFKKDEVARKAVRERYGFIEEDFVVLDVGQVQTRKGVGDFLLAAEKLPEIKFVWIGGKPFGKLTKIEKELEEKIASPPKNVLFAGQHKVEEMPDLYNLADCFFSPSYQENAPMAVIEAACVRLPLVLRDLSEYRSLYKEGYIAGGEENFAENIKRLKEDKDYYSKWSKLAISLAKKFNSDSLGDKLIQYYISLEKQ
jgi:1,2-diacylglycerol-3-alpha-glucose alpha-1,2-galactosyltransferase